MISKVSMQTVIRQSLQELSRGHEDLITNRAKEESINFHFATILQKRLLRKINVGLKADLEYNKHGWDDKWVPMGPRKKIRIRPDIIFHERYTDKKNLLVVECKKGAGSNHDRAKVIAMLSRPYEYRYGIVVSYRPGSKNFDVLFYHSYRGVVTLEEMLVPKK